MLNFAVTNVVNDGREIIIFHRTGRELHQFHDKTFFPYFYQPSPTGVFKSIDGKKLNKVNCTRPSDVAKRRDDDSYEADVLFTKRYIIDKITSFGKAEIKYSFVDIEVMCKELPNHLNPKDSITCISCSNSYTNEIKTFYLDDMFCKEPIDAEKELLDSFVAWLREEQFDLLLGWNFIAFDWLYLCARYKQLFNCELSEMLSPIAQSRYLGSSKSENQTLIPAGLSVCDYLDFYKKIYRTESSYALDAICQKHLNETAYNKVDFSILSSEIKEKNINDVRRMIDLEKKFKIVEYYDELRRMSMCDWSDVTWNSKMLDVVLLKEAKQKGIVLPSKHYGDDVEVAETFEGAYRRCDTGLYKNLWKLDLSSAYPMAIINFCLDIANIKEDGLLINKTKFYQNSNALLPSIAKKLIDRKDILKKQLKTTNPESQEYQDLQTKYDAIKGVVNSLFGVCGLKIFRLFDYRVASSITFLIRDLLHYVEEKLIEKGMKVIYIDTDSVFIDAQENPKDLCNELVIQWAKEKYSKDDVGIRFDLEGKFEKLFVIALCHYKGYLVTPKGVKEEIKGIEVRRKDSSNFIREFQGKLIEKVMNEESKESIADFINAEKERIKTLSLVDVGFPCRISKGTEEYKSIPVYLRALQYTQEIVPEFQKHAGDSFYWIPVVSFGKAMRSSSRNKTNKETGEKSIQSSEKEVNKDVLCYDEDLYKHITAVNWDKVIEKSITMKCEAIFEALKWDVSMIKEVKEKKIRVKKEKIEEIKVKDPVTYLEARVDEIVKAQSDLRKEILINDKVLEKEVKGLDNDLEEYIDKITKPSDLKDETFKVNHSFVTKAEITERTVMVAEAFGLGIDDEKNFTIYDNAELKVKQGDIVYVTGDSGSGKCQPRNSRVLMSDGSWRNIQDIRVGDKVISTDENRTKTEVAEVQQISNYYSENNYAVKNLRTNEVLYKCSGNHLIPVRTNMRCKKNKHQIRTSKQTCLTAEYLFSKKVSWLKNEQVVTYQGIKVDIFENRANPDIDAQFLGIFLGDGSFTTNHLPSISNTNKNVIDYVDKKYKIHKKYLKKQGKLNCYNLYFSHNVRDLLIKYQLKDKIAHNKFIPDEAKYADSDYRIRLLAGLLDTDGYVNKDGCISYTSASIQLVEDIKFIVNSLGGRASITSKYVRLPKTEIKRKYFCVSISLGQEAYNLPLLNQFKKQRIMNSKKLSKSNIVQFYVEKIENSDVFGICLDNESKLYITDNFTLTHNSWILKNIFQKLPNSISIDELQVNPDEVIVEGVGKDLHDALMKLNIAGLGDAFLYLRKYSQLSDGQKYRYRIAKFIDREDKNIWILDEFCATLDRVTAKAVAYNIQKIARKLNKTVVVATTHTDLLEEIRPTVHILKGYESDVTITYHTHEEWKGKKLEFYNDMKLEVGDKHDYEKLKKFHYRQASLGAQKKFYKCTYKDELVGVIAICYPHLALKGRNIALNNKLARMTKENCEYINKEIDYIARIIIHPKYRGIGLSQYMLKEYFKLSDATYTETVAVMANYSPFFERAGMERIDVELDDKRETSVKELEQYGFRVDLMSSTTYIRSTFNKLSEEDKEKVRELVIVIINKYKGASHIVFAKINKNPSWKEDLKKDDELLFEYFKQLRRSNTIYLIKKLK